MKKVAQTHMWVLSLANMIDWYDYGIYFYISPLLASIFLPPTESSPLSSSLFLFLIFTLCYSLRIVGGLIFGHIGDIHGRQKTLLWSVILTMIPSFFVSLLPSFADAGYIGFILLLVFRCIQSLPLGGEMPGMITFLTESAPSRSRTLYGSITFVGSGCGCLLAATEVLIMHHAFSREEVIDFAWRIPFFIGGCVALFGFYLRKKLHETPLFIDVVESSSIEKRPVHQAILFHTPDILRCALFTAFPFTAFYLLFMGLNTFLSEQGVISQLENIEINALCMAIYVVAIPIAGYIGDKIGAIKLYVISSIAFLVALSFPVLASSIITSALFIPYLILLSIILGGMIAPISIIFSYRFPTPVRYSSTAMAYNTTIALFASLGPSLSWIMHRFSLGPLSPFYYTSILGLFSLMVASTLREQKYLKHE